MSKNLLNVHDDIRKAKVHFKETMQSSFPVGSYIPYKPKNKIICRKVHSYDKYIMVEKENGVVVKVDDSAVIKAMLDIQNDALSNKELVEALIRLKQESI